MSNAIAIPENVQNMAAALAQSAAQNSGGGEIYMKFTKMGEWLYGVENIEVEAGSVWAINPGGMVHGFIAWGDKTHGTAGQNLGERLVPSTQPLPDINALPEVKGSWSPCVGMQLRCTNGEDEGVQVFFKTNSKGGRDAYASTVAKMVERMLSDEGKGGDFVPLVELDKGGYKHPEYGFIATPDIKIVGWANVADTEAPALEEKAPEPEPEPVAEIEEAEIVDDDEPADLPPVTRRRRRAASLSTRRPSGAATPKRFHYASINARRGYLDSVNRGWLCVYGRQRRCRAAAGAELLYRREPYCDGPRVPLPPGVLATMISIDLETRSEVDLLTAGAYRYAADESTDIICMWYSVDYAEPIGWHPGDPVPAVFMEEHGYCYAFNADFERLLWHYVLTPVYGFPPVPLELWRCTMFMARTNNMPGALGNAARCLNLPEQKNTRGRELIKLLCLPGADGTFCDDPALLEEMDEYCAQDVRAEMAVAQQLREPTPEEWEDYYTGCRINDRGVMIDVELCAAASLYADAENEELMARIVELTEGRG